MPAMQMDYGFAKCMGTHMRGSGLQGSEARMHSSLSESKDLTLVLCGHCVNAEPG